MSRSSLAAVVAVAPSSAAASPRPVLATPAVAAPVPLLTWTRSCGGVTMLAEQPHVATGQKAVPLTTAGPAARPRERDAAGLGRAGVGPKL